ncbi:unnamed protein product [Pedinophyceae sp. YPF-701]|nr:unnamed protein product [Pedinophyceae sp. YPF-701]
MSTAAEQPGGMPKHSEQIARSDLKANDAAHAAAEVEARIAQRVQDELASDPDFMKRSVSELSNEAVALYKQGDFVGCLAGYSKLDRKLAALNLTHPTLFVAESNRAAAFLALGLPGRGLPHAHRSLCLARDSLARGGGIGGAATLQAAQRTVVKATVRKASALMACGRNEEAASALQEGLAFDPASTELRATLDVAAQAALLDALEGRARTTRRLAAPERHLAITASPHADAGSLARYAPRDALPAQLLTPFQAQNSERVKDTFNYLTIKADLAVPARRAVEAADAYWTSRWLRAVRAAVREVEDARDLDCRVLALDAGPGALFAMAALRAGAKHATCVERWLYNASAAQEALRANGFGDEEYDVVHKVPTDVQLGRDVGACNLLVCGMPDSGLLTSGAVPALRHAIESRIMVEGAVVLPASATVLAVPVQVRSPSIMGVDTSPLDRHRGCPLGLPVSGAPVCPSAYIALAEPREIFHIDFAAPPTETEVCDVDFTFTKAGAPNAMLVWYDLRLYADVWLSTGPEAVAAGLTSRGPVLHYLPGDLTAGSIAGVAPGDTLTFQCAHNTTAMTFGVPHGEYLRLFKSPPDAAFPLSLFSAVADVPRLSAFCRAIQRAMNDVATAAPSGSRAAETHVLDAGCGSGLLSTFAARCGATSVLATDVCKSLAGLARSVAAVNGVSDRVTVLHRDAALLERGGDARNRGYNLLILDVFDPGLVGSGAAWLAAALRSKVLAPGARVVPARGTLWCMGVEVLASAVDGFDVSALDRYRFSPTTVAVRADRLRHRRLTRPQRVVEVDFQGGVSGVGHDSVIKLEVIRPGVLNAVLVWHDLQLDDDEAVTTAPRGVGLGGKLDEDTHADSGGGCGGQPGFLRAQSGTFEGPRDGYFFGCGDEGIGYYLEASRRDTQVALRTPPDAERAGGYAASDAADEHPHGTCAGQGLQHLDAAVRVSPGQRVTVLVRRDGGSIAPVRFALREGVGALVPRPPWLEEWGGGTSVENPHVQRPKYCDLLLSDFLMRCRGGAKAAIRDDLAVPAAQCGALFLDAASLRQTAHELALLEDLNREAGGEFEPGATLAATTEAVLELH